MLSGKRDVIDPAGKLTGRINYNSFTFSRNKKPLRDALRLQLMSTPAGDHTLRGGRCCGIRVDMERVFLGLGSNIGDRTANIERASRLIGEIEAVRLVRMSSLFETEPVGYEDQPDFINAVLEIGTPLTPRELLAAVKEIEQRMGRTRTVRFGPRIIDVDILLFGQRVIDEPGLTIPHPRMHERRFVLGPLAEIAPEAVHPVLKKSVMELYRDLSPHEK